MGLDGVELVMNVEDSFGIKILDEDAERIVTVGDLYREVLRRLPQSEWRKCMSAVTFYRFRRAVMDICHIDRKKVRPDAQMNTILPEKDRRANWKRLAGEMNWRLPGLHRGVWVQQVISILLFVQWLGLLTFAWLVAGRNWSIEGLVALSLFELFAALWFLLRITRPLATHFTPEAVTVRDVVQDIARMNFGELARDTGYDEADVWDLLRRIIVEQLGVEPELVTESARFVEDFGMD